MSFGEGFLANPALFPAERGGEPWGRREVTIHMPGGPYRFHGLDDTQHATVLERMGDLCVDRDGANPSPVEIEVFRYPDGHFLKAAQRGWTYSLDIDCHPASVGIAAMDFVGRLDWSPSLVGSLWTAKVDRGAFRGLFENYFRIVTSYRLLECNGAMIHSAGVVDSGDAYLFVGTSGSGKTTISTLSRKTGRRVLSDDLNAFQLMDAGPVAEKLPFSGDVGRAALDRKSYPIRAICRLVKGEKPGLRPMGRAEAIASLWTCSPNVNLNPYRQERLVANLESLTRSVPAWVLTFSLDGGFWDLLRNNCRGF